MVGPVPFALWVGCAGAIGVRPWWVGVRRCDRVQHLGLGCAKTPHVPPFLRGVIFVVRLESGQAGRGWRDRRAAFGGRGALARSGCRLVGRGALARSACSIWGLGCAGASGVQGLRVAGGFERSGCRLAGRRAWTIGVQPCRSRCLDDRGAAAAAAVVGRSGVILPAAVLGRPGCSSAWRGVLERSGCSAAVRGVLERSGCKSAGRRAPGTMSPNPAGGRAADPTPGVVRDAAASPVRPSAVAVICRCRRPRRTSSPGSRSGPAPGSPGSASTGPARSHMRRSATSFATASSRRGTRGSSR
jgi:hypothetical protein